MQYIREIIYAEKLLKQGKLLNWTATSANKDSLVLKRPIVMFQKLNEKEAEDQVLMLFALVTSPDTTGCFVFATWQLIRHKAFKYH